MKKKQKTCKNVLSFICDNIGADLNSQKCRHIKKHLSGCPDCAAYLDSLKKTITLYRKYPVPKAPAGFRRKLFLELGKEE